MPRPVFVRAALALTIVVLATSGCENNHTELANQLDPLLEEIFALNLSPGMSVAVVQDDEIVYSRGFGFADIEEQRPVEPNTYFYIASTTKSLTALAVALLAERGDLDLQASVAEVLPSLKLYEDLSTEDITLEMLLTHTHGISGGGPVVFRTAYSGDFTKEQLLSLTALHEPAPEGTAFRYSNIGYNIAGMVLEEVTGKSWKQAVNDLVIEPLGPNDTHANVSDLDETRMALPYVPTPEAFEPAFPRKTDKTMHAAGGHYTTSLDMAAWVGVHLNGGEWEGKQVFPRNVIDDAHAKHAEQDREFGAIHRFGWGLGWDLGTYGADTLVHRFGSYAGFRSHVSFMPSRNIGVVVLVNERGFGGFLADGSAFLIYDELSERADRAETQRALIDRYAEMAPVGRARLAEDLERRSERPQDLPHPLEAYAGTYENDAYGEFAVQPESDKLVFRIGGLSSVAEVFDNENNIFRVELTGSGQTISFEMQNERAARLVYQGAAFERVE